MKGEISLSEGSVETAKALLAYDLPPYASLSPLQGQLSKSRPSLSSLLLLLLRPCTSPLLSSSPPLSLRLLPFLSLPFAS